mgnify:FL=1
MRKMFSMNLNDEVNDESNKQWPLHLTFACRFSLKIYGGKCTFQFPYAIKFAAHKTLLLVKSRYLVASNIIPN